MHFTVNWTEDKSFTLCSIIVAVSSGRVQAFIIVIVVIIITIQYIIVYLRLYFKTTC